MTTEERNATRLSIDLAAWYPKLVAAGVPTPKTIIVSAPRALINLLEGHKNRITGYQRFIKKLMTAADSVGYPCFMRTGYGSGKHDYQNTCLVGRPEELEKHVFRLLEWSLSIDFFGLPFDTWVIRELLPTAAAFYAFRGRLPITRERRYFVSDGKILGHHPYWPPEAINDPSVENWRELLEVLNQETPEEIVELSGLSLAVSAAVAGDWSVDWLFVPDRGWVCIDLAWAEQSFVWTEYPTAPRLATPGKETTVDPFNFEFEIPE